MKLFVRVNTNYFTHPKTLKLKLLLGDGSELIPLRLWAFAADHHPDGDLSKYSAEELALFIGYSSNAQAMLQALLQAQFLDSDPLRIHDWEDHQRYHVNHASFVERAKKAAAARWGKEKERSKEKGVQRDRDKRIEKASNAPSITPSVTPSPAIAELPEVQILLFLNEKAGRQFRTDCEAHLAPIRTRLGDVKGDVEGIKTMILRKISEWKGTEDEKYLTPETLFRVSKFAKYYDDRQQPVSQKTGGRNGQQGNRNFGFASGQSDRARALAAAANRNSQQHSQSATNGLATTVVTVGSNPPQTP